MRRGLCVIVASLLCISLLSGCMGKVTSDTVKDRTVIHLWHPLTGGDGDYFNEIVKQFNASNQKYVVKVSVFKWDDYNAKLANGIAADAGPDLAVARNSFYQFLRTKDMTLELSNVARSVGIPWDEYNPLALSVVKEGDKYYGSPLDTHPVVMFYNKDILAKAGVLDAQGQPEFESTEEGFRAFLDKIAKVMPAGQYPIALPTYAKSAEQWYLWYTWYAQNGGKGLFNSDMSAPGINKAAFLKSASFEQSLYAKPYIQPNDTDFTQTFISGRAAICFTGVWATSKFMNQLPSLGAVAIPNLWNDQQIYYAGTHVLVIPSSVKDPQHQEGAATFMKYFNEHDLKWAEAGHVPVNMKVWTQTDYLSMPFRSLYTDIAQKVQYVEPQKDVFGLYENLLSPGLEMIWRGTLTPEEGYRKITSDLQFYLDY
ncbi:extracellular solute-binding protein [Paenibacillus sp. FSL R10-2734]|uniref:extracellular solute-binding protein n=1 Tax=Paenibacillus sp. FSL R10-2734 TaxID=2954691 RepID=UPI0030DD15CB